MERIFKDVFGPDAVGFDDTHMFNELLAYDASVIENESRGFVNGRGMAELLEKGDRKTAWRLVREGRATAAAKLMLKNDVEATLYPRVTIVAAVGKNGELGLEGQIPWSIPADMKHFRQLTRGGTVLVGRRTFESMGPLKGRRVVVISSKDVPGADGVITDPLEVKIPETGLFVCGGASVYDAYLDVANRMVLSRVPYDGLADVYFPEFEAEGWTMLSPPVKKDGFVVEEYHRMC
jgi:dihydrofolate reductase